MPLASEAHDSGAEMCEMLLTPNVEKPGERGAASAVPGEPDDVVTADCIRLAVDDERQDVSEIILRMVDRVVFRLADSMRRRTLATNFRRSRLRRD